MRLPVVCSIGSTDPTAGAGLFVDAAVYAKLGVHGTFVIAGVTAQNSDRVSAVYALPPRLITAQLAAVWRQVRPDAVRVGLLVGIAAIRAVDRFYRALRVRPPLVIDPVFSASSGRRFAGASEVSAIRSLLDMAAIVTPNTDEAEALAGTPVRNERDARRAALRIHQFGCAALVTGGHLKGSNCVDFLAHDGHVDRLGGRRLIKDMRGTGCVLSAAIAACLAKGDAIDVAARRANAFVRRAIRDARPIGGGRPQLRL